MITLLGSLIGFLGAAFPDILKLFRERDDRKHELAVLDKQVEMQRLGYMQRLDEIQTQAGIAESQAIYKTYKTGIHWVDALNGTVRPVLAYAFFLLYAVVKLMQYEAAGTLLILWNEEDQAIFAGIISFYFGQRAMHKLRTGK